MSCSDDFSSVIKTENETTGTGSGNNKPSVSFETSTSYTLNENETSHQVNILLSGSSDKVISVTVSDSLSGTAISGTDYMNSIFRGYDSAF